MKNRFEGEKTLNIFTDASILKLENGKYNIGCGGCVLVFPDGSTNFKTEVYYNATNNRSEMSAIRLALDMIIIFDLYNKFETINIFSDSKLCVLSLREWYRNWYNKSVGNVLYTTSSGEVVMNQDIIINILNKMCMIDKPINLYHQKGHVTFTNKGIDICHKTFNRSNGINLYHEELMFITKYNDKIDNYTRGVLYSNEIDTMRRYATKYIQNEAIDFSAVNRNLFICTNEFMKNEREAI